MAAKFIKKKNTVFDAPLRKTTEMNTISLRLGYFRILKCDTFVRKGLPIC